MGLYNFQKRFVPFIEAGVKKQTIRGLRRFPDQPGNTMHLYTGLRQKGVRLIGRVPCTKVDEILITEFQVRINELYLDDKERQLLARLDGFENFREMLQFFTLPFRGNIFHWKQEVAGT